MSKLVFGVSKIISKKTEDAAGYDIVALNFAEAYAQLRRACPRGDLRIHLSVEADSAAEVGAVMHDHNCGNMGGGCDCGTERATTT